MDAATVRWTAVVCGALGFAALGAGLIHLALAVGAHPGIATGLVIVGALEVLWGCSSCRAPASRSPASPSA